MLRSASSVTPGISWLPRTRGPMPERNKRLPTRFAWGNAPTGSGARELSKDSLILLLPTLSPGDRPHDKERFAPVGDRIRQDQIGRLMREVFFAGKETDQRAAFLRIV